MESLSTSPAEQTLTSEEREKIRKRIYYQQNKEAIRAKAMLRYWEKKEKDIEAGIPIKKVGRPAKEIPEAYFTEKKVVNPLQDGLDA